MECSAKAPVCLSSCHVQIAIVLLHVQIACTNCNHVQKHLFACHVQIAIMLLHVQIACTNCNHVQKHLFACHVQIAITLLHVQTAWTNCMYKLQSCTKAPVCLSCTNCNVALMHNLHCSLCSYSTSAFYRAIHHLQHGFPAQTLRVGQNPICTVHIRYFWQGNHQIYGHIRCIYTVRANPTNTNAIINN
jgi:hypothetical protein